MKSMEEFLKEKLAELEKLKVKAEKSLEKAPEGSLVLSSSNGAEQYYHRTERGQSKGKYIPAEKRKFAMALAQKDYDQKLLKAVGRDQKKIGKMLELLKGLEVSKVYEELAEPRKKLVKSYVLTDEQYVEKWLSVKYSGKTFLPDTPMIKTERGERVRSKAEKILADKFYAMGIPYRYEYPVKVKGYGMVYTDFTLLNIAERKEIYFEHFGMMDNPEYCQNAILKLEEYAKSGIVLGKNLLVTFETSQQAVDMVSVEKMLEAIIGK